MLRTSRASRSSTSSPAIPSARRTDPEVAARPGSCGRRSHRSTTDRDSRRSREASPFGACQQKHRGGKTHPDHDERRLHRSQPDRLKRRRTSRSDRYPGRSGADSAVPPQIESRATLSGSPCMKDTSNSRPRRIAVAIATKADASCAADTEASSRRRSTPPEKLSSVTVSPGRRAREAARGSQPGRRRGGRPSADRHRLRVTPGW